MKKFYLSAAVVAALTAGPALSQTTPPPAAQKVLTVSDVIGIANGIGQLDAHQTGQTDRLGNALSAPNNFHFSGTTLMTLGRDLERGRDVYNAYTAATNKLLAEISRQREALPKGETKEQVDEFNTRKTSELNAEQQKMLAAPADEQLDHVKLSDLCLEVKIPDCPSANEIPISILSLLGSIIDR